MTSLFAAAVLALALLQSGSAPPAATPVAPAVESPKEDPAVTALARKIYAQMRDGKVDSALFTEQAGKAMTPEALAQAKPIFTQLGDPTKLTLEKRETIPQGTAYEYLADFAAAQLHVVIVIDKEGKVAGYRVRP